jgi:hypothetical protein
MPITRGYNYEILYDPDRKSAERRKRKEKRQVLGKPVRNYP